MQQPPLSVLMAWPTPNFVNPETRGNAKIVLNIIFYIILMISIGIRLFTRTYLRKVFGPDDILILLALIPTTVFFIISILSDTHFMWTRHSYDIPISSIPNGLKMVLATEIMFAAACTLTKLSMLSLVRRILVASTLFWRRVTDAAIIIVALQGSIFCLTTIFQCRPPQDYWKITQDPQPNCVNQISSLLVAGIVNTLTDLIVVLLPIRLFWSLQIPTKEVLPLVLLFAFGFASCCAGIVRTYFTYQVFMTWDSVWASYPLWLSAACELYIGIICASIPATKPFFSSYLPQLFGSTPSTFANTEESFSRSYQLSKSGQRTIIVKNERLDSAGGDEELLEFDKRMGKASSSTTVFGREVRDIEKDGILEM